ncbi:MAG: DUF5333 family protein [Pseudomonadota bacterium]
MIRLPAYVLAVSLLAGPALAELRAAPDYFVGAIISTDVAQAIAVNCPKLSVNPLIAQEMSENVLAWLVEDGFDRSDPVSEMVDFSDRLQALQQRFMDKHDLEGANSAQVCAAGFKEMKSKTDIGNLLVEVAK